MELKYISPYTGFQGRYNYLYCFCWKYVIFFIKIGFCYSQISFLQISVVIILRFRYLRSQWSGWDYIRHERHSQANIKPKGAFSKISHLCFITFKCFMGYLRLISNVVFLSFFRFSHFIFFSYIRTFLFKKDCFGNGF